MVKIAGNKHLSNTSFVHADLSTVDKNEFRNVDLLLSLGCTEYIGPLETVFPLLNDKFSPKSVLCTISCAESLWNRLSPVTRKRTFSTNSRALFSVAKSLGFEARSVGAYTWVDPRYVFFLPLPLQKGINSVFRGMLSAQHFPLSRLLLFEKVSTKSR